MKVFITLSLFIYSLFAVCANIQENQLKYDKNSEKIIYFIPQFSNFDAISNQEMLFLSKIIKKAEKNNIRAVIFELDTPGGRVDIALKYISVLSKTKIPTIVYINPNGISAGMIISLGANKIAINPVGTIGDAMPIIPGFFKTTPIAVKPKKNEVPKDKEDTPKEPIDKLIQNISKISDINKEDKELVNKKYLAALFKIIETLSEKNNRPIRVTRAMVDPYQVLTEKEDSYSHSDNSPLILSAKDAKRLKVVDYISEDLDTLQTQLGLQDCEVQVIKRTTLEQIANFLSNSAISGILIMIGIIGIYIEVRSPGFGIPGILGLTALTLYFLGHVGVGNSGWGPGVIFFVGFILILLEVFVIPGFGIIGVLGIILMLISLFSAVGFDNIEKGINIVGISLFAAVSIITFLTIYILPKSTLFKRFVLDTSVGSNNTKIGKEIDIIGKVCIVHSTLRPSGSIMLGDKRYDAVSDSEFIEVGTEVIITDLHGVQVTVRKQI